MDNQTRNILVAKYEQVRRILLDRIRTEKIHTGETIPSESNLMKEFGVSRVTIRRALGQLVRDGILRSQQGTGYVVRGQSARPTVGLVYGEQLCGPEDVPTYRLMIHSLQRILADQHLQLHLYNIRAGATGFSSDRDKLIGDLRKGILAGLVTVAWPCYEEESVDLARSDRELLSLMKELNVPFSGLGALPEMVLVDMTNLGYLGTKHFLDQGLRRVAVIGGFNSPSEKSNSAIEGYRRAFGERGLAFNPEWIIFPKELSRPAGYMAVRRLWSLSDRPEAIVITDDFVAQGAMTAILELSIKVPETLQLATFYVRGGDLFFPKPFIRLEVAPEDLARQMSARLLDVMKEPEKHREPIVYQPRVVVDTTGPEWSSRKPMTLPSVPRESRPFVAVTK